MSNLNLFLGVQSTTGQTVEWSFSVAIIMILCNVFALSLIHI